LGLDRTDLHPWDIKAIQYLYGKPNKNLVVVNDINLFDDEALDNTGNQNFLENLVTTTTEGLRSSGDRVWIDCGRNSDPEYIPCGSTSDLPIYTFEPFISTIEDLGFNIDYKYSTSGSLTSIPEDVKIIFLWAPQVAYTLEEINTFKSFAAEGGRIIFVGEHADYYTYFGDGIALENEFLKNMGSKMSNAGNSIECGFRTLTSSSILEDPLTNNVTSLDYGCFSELELSPSDVPLFVGQNGSSVLGARTKISTEPSEELFEVSTSSFGKKQKISEESPVNPRYIE